MLFEEIDKELTKRNVSYILSRYHNIKRLSGSYTPKVTASYSIVPRSSTGLTSDPVGDAVTRKITAEETLKDIEKAFNCLPGESRKRLYFKYLAEDRQYDYQIYTSQNISRNTYYRELEKAQLEFAEAYRGGVLLAFEVE